MLVTGALSAQLKLPESRQGEGEGSDGPLLLRTGSYNTETSTGFRARF